jgi:PAS domain S-box-containing protein
VTRQTRVLVVDDSGFAETTAGTLTAEHDIEATHETSAADALETLAGTDVDCLVSDAGMPGIDGVGFLEAVRERHDGLPFVVLARRGDEEVPGGAVESGVTDYLLKLEIVEDEQYSRLASRIESVVARRQTRRKYEQLVEHSPDGIVHVGEDGTVLTANPAMADRLGTDRESLVGTDITEVLPAGTGTRRLSVGRQTIETGQPRRTEDSHDDSCFDNIFVPLETRCAHGSFQLISRDITERREYERELERQSERLESFASVVSHELRNPLNVAQSSIELLSDDCEAEHVDRIERSLVRMGDIIEDVLTLAREGQTVSDPSPVDLATMAEDAWRHVETGDVTLSVAADRRVEADADRLQDLLGELFANAVEHGDGVSRVTVGTTPEGFFVADDGGGIPADHRGDVFEAGFSTDRTGTGLGLNIVRGVANAHGWTVEVDEGGSESGGARFDIAGVSEL